VYDVFVRTLPDPTRMGVHADHGFHHWWFGFWMHLFLFYTFLFEIAYIKKLWAYSWRMNFICVWDVVWWCHRAMLFSRWYMKLFGNYRFFHNFIWTVLNAWFNCMNVFKLKEKHWQTVSQNTVSLFQYKYRLSSLIWLQLAME